MKEKTMNGREGKIEVKKKGGGCNDSDRRRGMEVNKKMWILEEKLKREEKREDVIQMNERNGGAKEGGRKGRKKGGWG